ncbi:GreA/GreB family elongation factor [Geomonas edaphica]|uniref:GreA/GreB family elongation factor n=1 Tax=Geomonas edaphica TaxID=2570226 RepID=UPI0010A8FE2F|nr:GreA/GreB family elongation factor [Geomonas edaphica]
MKAAKAAHEAAIHEENIPDNKYDTLSLEASYVAQGQANRAQEVKLALQAYRGLSLQPFNALAEIRLTALVTLEGDDGALKTVFIGPQEGGLKLLLDGEEVLVITPSSPMGRELIGKSLGDTVEIGSASYEIVDLC